MGGGGRPTRDRVAVLARTWWQPHAEATFVLRSLAGALSRHVEVDVLAPGEPGTTTADGLFDVWALGRRADHHGWPEPSDAAWPNEASSGVGLGDPLVAAIVEAGDAEARAILQHHAPGLAVVAVAAARGPSGNAERSSGRAPRVVTPAGLRLHLPVNPLAAERPHNGFGFTDYLLVLTDRRPHHNPADVIDSLDPGEPPDPVGLEEPRSPEGTRPTPLAAWLIARFPRLDVVVVEDATASAWHNRSLRGAIHVDTRTDLWRLMAFARAIVDLRPGPLIARECIESLRFATPVVAPAGCPALGDMAGVSTFTSVAELLDRCEALSDEHHRDAEGCAGREAADARHGDPAEFVRRAGQVLDQLR